MRRLAVVSSIVALVGCSGDPCDRDTIADALANATGGTVTLPECTMFGGVTIPPGVALVGASKASVVEIGPSDGPIVLQSGGSPARLQNVRVRLFDGVAIESTGTGSVQIEDVEVEVDAGIGVQLDQVATASLVDVEIVGSAVCGGATTGATHGLRITDVADAQLTNVTVQRFSVAGVAAFNSALTWTGGDANNNMNVGVFAQAGTVMLEDIALDRTCAPPALPHGYAAYFDGQVTVDTQGLSVQENEGFGLVHAGAAGTRPLAAHLGLTAINNDKPAVWAQSADALEVSGSLVGNGSGAVVALDSASLALHDLEVRDTQLIQLVLETTAVPFGDGIQIVGPTPGSSYEDITITNSGRAGLLIDVAGQTLPATTFSNVEITAPAMAIGARAQNGVIPAGWDQGILRTNTSSTADQAGGPIDPTGVIGPCEQPAI